VSLDFVPVLVPDRLVEGQETTLGGKKVNAMARDPVCGMQVDEKSAVIKAQHNGQTYYFCSPGCKATFEKEPARYTSAPGTGSGHGGHMGH